jgi:hypothetical protein
MALFGNGSVPPYPNTEAAQAAANYTDHAGGWHEPDPPTLGRDFDPAQDDEFTNSPHW